MERKEFLKRGFGSLLGMAAIAPILGACQQTEVEPFSTTTTGTGGTTTTTGSTNIVVSA